MHAMIEYKGERFPLTWAIEDVIDEYFGGDEELITHLTLAFEDYMRRKVDNHE